MNGTENNSKMSLVLLSVNIQFSITCRPKNNPVSLTDLKNQSKNMQVHDLKKESNLYGEGSFCLLDRSLLCLRLP